MASSSTHRFPSSRDSELAMPHHLTDPAFEPHSTFAFEDAGNDFRDMHQGLISLDDFDHDSRQHLFFAHHKTAAVSKTSSRSDAANGAGGMPMYTFRSEPMSPQGILWTAEHAALTLSPPLGADAKLAAQVHQQFGQITPPDDGSPHNVSVRFAQNQPTSSSARLSPSTIAHPSAKSERARNAANQRHAKAKKSRQDSGTEILSPESEEIGSSDEKRGRYREKNRLAAAKCRAKKKTNVEDLEDRARTATARNSQLKLQARELRDIFSELRSHALMHDPSQGCPCQQIHMYNANKAQEAARGAVTRPAFLNTSLHECDLMDVLAVTSSGGFDHLSAARSVSGPSHGLPTHQRHHSAALHKDMPGSDDTQQGYSAFTDLSFEED